MVAVFITVQNLCAQRLGGQAVQTTFQWGCQSSHSFYLAVTSLLSLEIFILACIISVHLCLIDEVKSPNLTSLTVQDPV